MEPVGDLVLPCNTFRMLVWFFFFLVAFGEEFTRISLCPYSASSPHTLILCLLTRSKFQKQVLKRVAQGTFL